MIRLPKNTPQRLTRGSLLLVGATLIGATGMATPTGGEFTPEEAAPKNALDLPIAGLEGLHEALLGGNFWVKLRYRFENVDQRGLTKDARASTLQTRFGYETGQFNGLSGVLEFSDVSAVPGAVDDYDDGTGNPNGRPVVADPTETIVNQIYVQYSGAVPGTIKVGRQRIKLGQDRFIGNVGWRQTEQNYDSVTYKANFDNGVSVYYGYLDRANTITTETQDLNSHLLNLSMSWDNIGTLTAYGYYLDFPDGGEGGPTDTTFSTLTVGARFRGENNMGDFAMLYGLEVGQQTDVEDNPNNVNATYSHTHLGVKAQGVTAKIGFESLEGTKSGNDARAFQTPLATLHSWNGWADQFLTTPARGLEDLYFHLGYEQNAYSAAVIYHEFDPETGRGDYGNELDAVLKYNFNEDFTVGLKAANYNSQDGSASDTKKAWFWMSYAF